MIDNILGVIATLIVILGGIGAFCLWLWRKAGVGQFSRGLANAVIEINGTPAKYDRAGNLIEEGQPSLMAQVAVIRQTVADQAQQNERLNAIELGLAEHGHRLDRLEAGHQLERLAGKIESTAAWQAVEAVARDAGDDASAP